MKPRPIRGAAHSQGDASEASKVKDIRTGPASQGGGL
jgi:hypothetical protein